MRQCDAKDKEGSPKKAGRLGESSERTGELQLGSRLVMRGRALRPCPLSHRTIEDFGAEP